MTGKARWLIVLGGLLSAATLAVGVVFGFTAVVTVTSAAGTIGALLGVLAQLMPPTAEPDTARPRMARRDRAPWLVLGVGVGLIVIVGVTLVAIRDNSSATSARGSGQLDVHREISLPAAVDLTSVGTLDWIKWGYLPSDATNPDEFADGRLDEACTYDDQCAVRKRGAGLIGDLVALGNTTPQRFHYRDDPTTFRWSDGEPVAAATGVRSQVMTGLDGNGFRITAPASEDERVLVLYAGTHEARVRIVATLSDDSAPPVRDNSFTSFGDPDLSRFATLTFTYRADRDDQTLTVDLTVIEDSGGSNISLFAAALHERDT